MKEDKLHRLVQSLSSSEKRYFRLQSKNQGEPTKYLRLFDTIQKMDVYNGAALKAAHPEIRQISAAKSYLFDSILRGMRLYRSQKKFRARIKGQMTDAIFLFEKNMIEEAAHLFEKVWDLAEIYEEYPTMLEILIWQRRILKHSKDKKREVVWREQINKKEQLITRITGFFEAYDLYDGVFMGLQQEGYLPQDGSEAGPHGYHQKDEEKEGEGFHTQRLRMQAFMTQCIRTGKQEMAFEWALRILDLWEGRSELKKEYLPQYRYLVANQLHFLALKEQWEEIPPLLDNIRELPVHSPYENRQNQQVIFLYEQLLALNTKELSKAPALAKKIESWLKPQAAGILPHARKALIFNNLSIYFVNHVWKSAFRTLYQLYQLEGKQFRKDLEQAALIIELILLFETGDIHQLDLRYRSSLRALRKQTGDEAPTVAFLKVIRRVFNSRDREQAKPHLSEALRILKADASSSLYPGRGRPEFILWLRSRLLNKPMYLLLEAREEVEGV